MDDNFLLLYLKRKIVKIRARRIKTRAKESSKTGEFWFIISASAGMGVSLPS
jgi:hypothetical protein